MQEVVIIKTYMQGGTEMSRKMLLLLIPFLLFYGLQVEAVEKEERNWQDEIIYSIMIDRFYNGDTSNDVEVDIRDPLAYHGGDFKGITEKLEYIKDLGFTTISLSPIVQNVDKGYHGYWPEDYYKVEEHFGTLEDFKTLVAEAHDKELKVIVDLVVNTDAEQNLVDIAKWWITETDLDGYRLLNDKNVPKENWKRLATEVKRVKEDFLLIGEVLHEDKGIVPEYDETGLDMFVDYSIYNEISTTLREPDQRVDVLYNVWLTNKDTFENPYLLGNFIDTHDTPRFTREVIQNKQNPETRLKLALTYLYGVPGIPIIFYGTEIALDGGKAPDNHRLMGFRADKVIIDYMAKLADIRMQHPSLRYGNFDMLFENKGMAIFKRTYEDEATILAINNASETIAAEIPEGAIGENQELRALLSDEIVRPSEGQFVITMDRETANIYMLHEKTGINWSFILGMVGVWVAFGLFLLFVKKRSKQRASTE
jgi:alpha-amylase